MFLHIAGITLIILFLSTMSAAHCPLCTAGAGAAAAGAAYLGVAKPVLGLLIGALGVSMGSWFAKKIPRTYIPYQHHTTVVASFVLTVIPLLPVIGKQVPLFIGWYGSYGSLLHNTYMYDLSLVTALLGGLIVTVSPTMSAKLTAIRDKHIDYQGILITLTSLLVFSTIIQVLA
ncbi:MAG: hypothetical protein MUP66_00210 [Candidatus Nanohaloarchaeota archaeon QJJ-5]|nr:hypothetical protein [Candidatus Nanohaloarchaeota archaeon QJJ-5]